VREIPWPVRGVLAGAAGTAAMTLAYHLEHRLRPGVPGQLDYDDSLVPGQIVATVLHLPSVTDREEAELGTLLRWGYGSAFGTYHVILRRLMPEPWASLVFGGTLLSATFSLFPLLGRTPPPWRWPADVLATSIGTHVAYVGAVAAVDALLRRPTAAEIRERRQRPQQRDRCPKRGTAGAGSPRASRERIRDPRRPNRRGPLSPAAGTGS
jgi:hypothetical protein